MLTARFQSDPLERRFSKYRQMSGGRYLVAWREVKTSDKILQMKSLLKEGFDFWKMDLQPNDVSVDNFEEVTSSFSNEIQKCELNEDSSQVAVFIAGYITKKFLKKSQCEACLALLLKGDSSATEYVNTLSRGGLMIPSQYPSVHVCHCFATLGMIK